MASVSERESAECSGGGNQRVPHRSGVSRYALTTKYLLECRSPASVYPLVRTHGTLFLQNT